MTPPSAETSAASVPGGRVVVMAGEMIRSERTSMIPRKTPAAAPGVPPIGTTRLMIVARSGARSAATTGPRAARPETNQASFAKERPAHWSDAGSDHRQRPAASSICKPMLNRVEFRWACASKVASGRRSLSVRSTSAMCESRTSSRDAISRLSPSAYARFCTSSSCRWESCSLE